MYNDREAIKNAIALLSRQEQSEVLAGVEILKKLVAGEYLFNVSEDVRLFALDKLVELCTVGAGTDPLETSMRARTAIVESGPYTGVLLNVVIRRDMRRWETLFSLDTTLTGIEASNITKARLVNLLGLLAETSIRWAGQLPSKVLEENCRIISKAKVIDPQIYLQVLNSMIALVSNGVPGAIDAVIERFLSDQKNSPYMVGTGLCIIREAYDIWFSDLLNPLEHPLVSDKIIGSIRGLIMRPESDISNDARELYEKLMVTRDMIAKSREMKPVEFLDLVRRFVAIRRGMVREDANLDLQVVLGIILVGRIRHNTSRLPQEFIDGVSEILSTTMNDRVSEVRRISFSLTVSLATTGNRDAVSLILAHMHEGRKSNDKVKIVGSLILIENTVSLMRDMGFERSDHPMISKEVISALQNLAKDRQEYSAFAEKLLESIREMMRVAMAEEKKRMPKGQDLGTRKNDRGRRKGGSTLNSI
ncbi:MAG: hypothetical protein QXP42_01810 [Candidatus Micrarchaeia archaeon]